MEIKASYKQTDVGVIPKDWEVKVIGDIFSISGGFSSSRSQLSNEGYCYLHYGDIHGSTKQYTDVEKEYLSIPKLNIDLRRISPASLLGDGDIVFVDASEDDEGASRHIVIRNPKAIPFISGLHTIVIKSNDDSVVNLYKQFCFQTSNVKKQFKYYSVGTKVTGISKTNIAKIKIALPLTKAEQTAIATTLSDADVLIGNMERLIAKKRNIKQGAMQLLLTGKKRLPGFTGEWQIKKLADILKVRHGKSQYGIRENDGKYPILATSGEIGRTNQFLYDKPSVLIGRKGTIDYPQYMDTPFWTIDTLFYTEIFPSAVPRYVFYYFQTIKWLGYNEASGVPSLNASTIEDIELRCPQVPEQTAIANLLSDMDAEIEGLEHIIAKYKMIKQGMMQELLTGKKRLI